mgnify:CR=1 FL=1|jgi:hypothetical protein
MFFKKSDHSDELKRLRALVERYREAVDDFTDLCDDYEQTAQHLERSGQLGFNEAATADARRRMSARFREFFAGIEPDRWD